MGVDVNERWNYGQPGNLGSCVCPERMKEKKLAIVFAQTFFVIESFLDQPKFMAKNIKASYDTNHVGMI